MKKLFILSLVLSLTFYSCQDSDQPQVQQQNKFDVKLPESLKSNRASNGRIKSDVKSVLNSTVFANSNIKISEVHVCKLAEAHPAKSVETLDKQFQSTLSSRWVPNDQRRNWNGDNVLNDIDWMPFPFFSVANGAIDASPIYRSMYSKWQNDGTCKTVTIDENTYDLSMGNPSLILGLGPWDPAAAPLADVSVLGFLPASVFESVFGEPNILGVAFSFVFIDDVTGEPIKTTRGKDDKAYTEVWFNDGFTWTVGPGPGSIDLESVVLHEFGHTMNLGHFGILQLFTNHDGTTDLVYQPVNTMNAFYIGEARNFLGQNDKGNFCEAWGSWPWN
jgi:hypothetical protein